MRQKRYTLHLHFYTLEKKELRETYKGTKRQLKHYIKKFYASTAFNRFNHYFLTLRDESGQDYERGAYMPNILKREYVEEFFNF